MFTEFLSKWKNTIILILTNVSFIWVFYHLIIDMKAQYNLREGLKCDKRLPHLIPEVNNSQGVKVTENFWHSDDD